MAWMKMSNDWCHGVARFLGKSPGVSNGRLTGNMTTFDPERGGGSYSAPSLWTPKESEVKSYEHQDNANIHCQPFPESVSEEREIYADDDAYHRQHVKRGS
jgi:hypothetical protein